MKNNTKFAIKTLAFIMVWGGFNVLMVKAHLDYNGLDNNSIQVQQAKIAQTQLTQMIQLSQLNNQSERLANMENLFLEPEEMLEVEGF